MATSPDPPQSRRSFTSAAAMTYVTNIAVAVMSLANVLIAARVLGPSGRGHVAFLTTIGTLVAFLFNMGVQQSNANVGATRPELRSRLATNSVLLALVFAALAIVVVLGTIAIFPAVAGESSRGLRLLALGSVFLLILQQYLSLLVQADYGFTVTNISWLVAPLTNLIGNGVLAIAGALTVETAVVTWVVGWGLAAAVLVVHVARHGGFGRPDLSLARGSVGFGLKAHAGRIMLVGNYRLDQWFVGAIAGARELGLYSIAVAWAELLFFLPTALVSVQRPDLVRATVDQARRLGGAVFRFALASTGVLALGLVVAAPVLCVKFFGPGFRGATDDLRILAAGGFGVAALKLLGNVLTAQRKPMLETAAIAVGFVASVVLDILLVPRWGGAGAAVASTLSYTLGGVAVALIFARALGGGVGDLWPRVSDFTAVRSRLRPARGAATTRGDAGQ